MNGTKLSTHIAQAARIPLKTIVNASSNTSSTVTHSKTITNQIETYTTAVTNTTRTDKNLDTKFETSNEFANNLVESEIHFKNTGISTNANINKCSKREYNHSSNNVSSKVSHGTSTNETINQIEYSAHSNATSYPSQSIDIMNDTSYESHKRGAIVSKLEMNKHTLFIENSDLVNENSPQWFETKVRRFFKSILSMVPKNTFMNHGTFVNLVELSNDCGNTSKVRNFSTFISAHSDDNETLEKKSDSILPIDLHGVHCTAIKDKESEQDDLEKMNTESINRPLVDWMKHDKTILANYTKMNEIPIKKLIHTPHDSRQPEYTALYKHGTHRDSNPLIKINRTSHHTSNQDSQQRTFSTIISESETSIALINSKLSHDPEAKNVFKRREDAYMYWGDFEFRNRDVDLMMIEKKLSRNYTIANTLGIRCFKRFLQGGLDEEDAWLKTTSLLEKHLHRFTDVISYQFQGSGSTRFGTQLFTSSENHITTVLVEFEDGFATNLKKFSSQIKEMLHYQGSNPNPSFESIILEYSSRSDSHTFVFVHDEITDEKLGDDVIENFKEFRRCMTHATIRLARYQIKVFHYYTGRGVAVSNPVQYDPAQSNCPKTYHIFFPVLKVEDILSIIQKNDKFSHLFHTGLAKHFAIKALEQTGGIPIYVEYLFRLLEYCRVVMITGYDIEQLVEVTASNWIEKFAPDTNSFKMDTKFDRDAAILLYALGYHGLVLSKDMSIEVNSSNTNVPIVELISKYPFYVEVVHMEDETFRIVNCPYHSNLFKSQFSSIQKIDPRYQYYFPELGMSCDEGYKNIASQLIKFGKKKRSNYYDEENVVTLNKILSSVNVVDQNSIIYDDVPQASKRIRFKLDVYDTRVHNIVASQSLEDTILNALKEASMDHEDPSTWNFYDLRENDSVRDVMDFRSNNIYLLERKTDA